MQTFYVVFGVDVGSVGAGLWVFSDPGELPMRQSRFAPLWAVIQGQARGLVLFGSLVVIEHALLASELFGATGFINP